MIGEAIDYPRKSDDWTTTVLIGGVMLFLNFLILPWIIVVGYIVAVARTTVEGHDTPPSFDDWERLIVDGVKGAVIGFVYYIPAIVVFFVTFGGFIFALILGRESNIVAGLGIIGFLIGTMVTFVLWIIATYIIPGAFTHFAVEGRMMAGFDLSALREVVLSSDYLVGWVLALIIGTVGSFIYGAVYFFVNVFGAVLSIIPILGFILYMLIFFVFSFVASFFMFYIAVTLYRIYARSYAKALDMDKIESGGQSS